MTIYNPSRAKISKFKGVKFNFRDSNIKSGLKFSEFEYPLGDKRDIETRGILLKKITVNAIIDCNKNYKNRDELEKAFTDGKAGYLSLPFYKKYYGFVVSFDFKDSQSSVGITDVNFEFVEVAQNGVNKKKGKGFLASLKSKILGDYEDDFDKTFANVKDYKEKFDSAVDTFTEVASTINNTASAVAGAGDSLADLSISINQIVNSANNLVRSPKILANNIKIVFDNMSVAYQNSKDLFKACKNLFGIDKKDRIQIGISQNSIDIRNNQELINQAVRINALTLGYQVSADIDYSNVKELNDTIADLEYGFQKIDFTKIENRDIIDNLHNLRYQAINYLNSIILSVPNLIDYEVRNPMPLINILYNLYGVDAENNKDFIININNIEDTSNISGVIKVLKYQEQ